MDNVACLRGSSLDAMVNRTTESMVVCAGPLATRNCEPRQAWKGAAAAVDVCAEVWLVWAAAFCTTARSNILSVP